MIKVLFICHGNICRSPMAEFIFRDMVKKENISDKIEIASCAISREELGNPVYYAAKEKLNEMGIRCMGKTARIITKRDYNEYDYILAMEDKNISGITKITGEDKDKKVFKLLDFAGGGNISDPWYTRDFDRTAQDIIKGCEGFLSYLKENNKI